MIKKIFIACALLLNTITGFSQQQPKNWTMEAHSPETKICFFKDTIEVNTPKGLTLWYNTPISGNYHISYKAKVIMTDGVNDRLSDLNCFWGAKDPKFPKNIFERSNWRSGIFANYNTLDLFYVGYGGNFNTTTRFRQYLGGNFEMDNPDVRPVLKEYTDADHLLKANKWYEIKIVVANNTTTYSVNGEILFSYQIKKGEGDGYFGLRLLQNHVLICDLKFENAKI